MGWALFVRSIRASEIASYRNYMCHTAFCHIFEMAKEAKQEHWPSSYCIIGVEYHPIFFNQLPLNAWWTCFSGVCPRWALVAWIHQKQTGSSQNVSMKVSPHIAMALSLFYYFCYFSFALAPAEGPPPEVITRGSVIFQKRTSSSQIQIQNSYFSNLQITNQTVHYHTCHLPSYFSPCPLTSISPSNFREHISNPTNLLR